MRILVVDDEEDTRTLLKDLLTRADHEVVLAASAAEALIHLHMHPLDLILLDVMMPGVDGHLLAQFLSSQWDTFDIPIVMVTCRTDPESHGWAKLNGCAGYLEKPFSPTELFDLIRQIELKGARTPLTPIKP